MKTIRVIGLSVIIGIIGGCRAAEPERAKHDGITEPMSPEADAFGGCPAQPTLPAPILDPYPQLTSNTRQPLRGRAPMAATITAISGAGTARPVPVSSDGSFCIEVDLLRDAPNQVTLVPRSVHGCIGQTSKIQLRHQTAAGKTDSMAPTSSVIRNVAAGRPVTTEFEPDAGDNIAITDGNAGSSAEFSFSDPDLTGEELDKFTWIRVDLGKVYTVSKVKIHWANSDFGRGYQVLLSSSQRVPAPDPNAHEWNVAIDETDGQDAVQDRSVTPQSARWVALLLYEDGALSFIFERFNVAELEVMGQDPTAVPSTPSDSCAY